MLRLQLLGGFRAVAEAGELPALARQPRRAALLSYLAVERDVAREKVIALLWPEADGDRGRHSLNQGIYSLRRIIGADWVELRADRCVVAPWIATDVAELERAAREDRHEDVVALYRGPFLAGTSVVATVDFDLWVDGRRASIDRLHRRARRRHLAALVAAGRDRDALACAEQWCGLDPLEDEAQHRYMELLSAAGQRGQALKQFHAYRRLLDEHGLKPLEETLELVGRLEKGEVGPLPSPPESPPAQGGARREEPSFLPNRRRDEAGLPSRLLAWVLETRMRISGLLVAVFLLNWVQTSLDALLAANLPTVEALRMRFAAAAHWFERGLAFETHALTSPVATVGYSLAYFALFPILVSAVGVAFARRPDLRPYRVFALALVLAYLVSLPFFIFFPMPERWWYSEAGAILLSDLWAPVLIDLFRPFSGLDNSFPSAHVSLTVVLVLTGFLFALRFSWTLLFLSGVIVLSTFVLGIHWLTDIVAGIAVGILAVSAALEVERRLPSARAGARLALVGRSEGRTRERVAEGGGS